MRVIRTEIYFEGVRKLALRPSRNEPDYYPGPAGISFAWYKGENPALQPVQDPSWFDAVDGELPPIEHILDLFLLGAPKSAFQSYRPNLIHPEEVREALALEVVIERSPLEQFPFKELLKLTNVQYALGAYIGHLASTGHDPMLMLITVPTGILVVSSAIGISRAIERGLHDKFRRLFQK